MKLYLVQTGEALPLETTDVGRPLSPQGRRNIERMASMLSGADMAAKRIIHSGAVRAKQTLELLQWAAAPSRPGPEICQGLGREDPVEPWIQGIESWAEDTIVVCHHPFIGRLASRLVTGREEPVAFSFVPGTALCLERGPAGWSVGWMIPPGAVAGFGRY